MADPQEIAKWRRAHQGISVPDEGLRTVAPFPSLYAGDFAVFLEASGGAPQTVSFVVGLNREVAWVYDNWAKAQHDGNPQHLIEDMLNAATSSGEADYSLVRKFLRDYAKANGIVLAGEQPEQPSWMDAFRSVGISEGTGTSSTDGDTVFPQAHASVALGGLTAPPSLPPEAPDAVSDR